MDRENFHNLYNSTQIAALPPKLKGAVLLAGMLTAGKAGKVELAAG